MEVNEVVMVSGCRTPIGRFLGSLSSVRANDLSMITGAEAIKRAGIEPTQVDELVLGMCMHHGNGSLPPRQVAMGIGMSHESGASQVTQNCAASMRATEIAAMSLALGKSEIALVVGTESMSNIPYISQNTRSGARLGDAKLQDALLSDGLIDKLAGSHMGGTADNVAKKWNITREECDQLALISHTRAAKAVGDGIFDREYVPVEIKSKKGSKFFGKDEHFIPGANLEAMGKLPPAFNKDGVTTAANASGINDGSAAIVLMTAKKAKELGVKPLAKLLSICTYGVDPYYMGIGPAYAIPKALKQAGLKYDNVDYWEINEAFAAQFIGVGKIMKEEFGIEMNSGTLETQGNINHNGSGIALGHPVGCTGARLQVSLIHEMERIGATIGGASTCVGGGPAMACIWTRDI
ncbi:MAG: thiolase family protein [Eubacteriales bacterium]|nr:thiolase family protein [Syntrophomonas wolfei]MDD4390442.1 thiolase family protein [Eubacteriales bacterium]